MYRAGGNMRVIHSFERPLARQPVSRSCTRSRHLGGAYIRSRRLLCNTLTHIRDHCDFTSSRSLFANQSFHLRPLSRSARWFNAPPDCITAAVPEAFSTTLYEKYFSALMYTRRTLLHIICFHSLFAHNEACEVSNQTQYGVQLISNYKPWLMSFKRIAICVTRTSYLQIHIDLRSFFLIHGDANVPLLMVICMFLYF